MVKYVLANILSNLRTEQQFYTWSAFATKNTYNLHENSPTCPINDYGQNKYLYEYQLKRCYSDSLNTIETSLRKTLDLMSKEVISLI